MKKYIIIAGFISLLAVVLYVCPPFLMPGFLYQLIYGGRYPKEWRCGDCLIVDSGPREGIDRYSVTFGKYDLFRDNHKTWGLCKLPQEKLYGGLAISLSENRKWEHEKGLAENYHVSMKLFNNNELIFEESGNLASDWIWSGPIKGNKVFVYGDTAFTPNSDMIYKLEIEVESKKAEQGIVADIIFKGGGWK